jgi:hypothetical protein
MMSQMKQGQADYFQIPKGVTGRDEPPRPNQYNGGFGGDSGQAGADLDFQNYNERHSVPASSKFMNSPVSMAAEKDAAVAPYN